MNALVLLNTRARGGAAAARYAEVRPILERTFTARTIELDREGGWRADVARAARAGVRVFVAAGGDGTVSALAGELMALRSGAPILGAIGLGSSNDFHKPFSRTFAGVPLRLGVESRATSPVTRVRTTGPDGAARLSYSVVSASAGVTAAGNRRYGELGSSLKRRCPLAAMGLAALSAVFAHEDVPCRLVIDGEARPGPFANVSIARTPYLAGPLAYEPSLGALTRDRLAVNVAGPMSRGEVVGALVALARGRFLSRPKTWHASAKVVTIERASGFDLEIDGEVERVSRAVFDVCEEGLAVCGA